MRQWLTSGLLVGLGGAIARTGRSVRQYTDRFMDGWIAVSSKQVYQRKNINNRLYKLDWILDVSSDSI